MLTDSEILLNECTSRLIHYDAAITPRLIIKAMISNAIEFCY